MNAKIRIKPDLPPTRLGPLMHVARQASRQAPSPPWIVAEEDVGSWLHELTSTPAGERSRGVVVVHSEEALLQCIRLAVGGALWEPPSTAAMTLSFQAAHDRPEVAAVCDLCVTTALAAQQPPRFVVRWRNQALWRHQLGEPWMALSLWKLARALGAVPAVVPGPCLLLAEVSPDAAAAAVAGLEAGGDVVPGDGLEILNLPQTRTAEDAVAVALRIACSTILTCESSMAPRPVYELPSGRRLGWWCSGASDLRPRTGWIATPETGSEMGLRWRLTSADGGVRWAHEVVSAGGIPTGSNDVVRIKGWAALRVRPGSPPGLLTEHLVNAAQRRGTTVWLPNVDHDAVELALRLGATVWVDGPAAPRCHFDQEG